MKKHTKADHEMKSFRPTPDMIRAAEACFAAMAMTETIRPIVEGYQRRILEEEKYPYSPKHLLRREKAPADYISDLRHTYMMSKDDFSHYLKRCREEQTKAGLHTDSPKHCPLLVAEDLQRRAENALIDALEPVTGINQSTLCFTGDFLGKRAKFLDLTLRFMAGFVDTKGTLKRFGGVAA